MIYIRSGAHVLELLQLLSVAGEFPMSGLSILGNPRTMRELIHRLEDRQEIEASWSGKRYGNGSRTPMPHDAAVASTWAGGFRMGSGCAPP